MPKNRVNREASEIYKLCLLGSSICKYSSHNRPQKHLKPKRSLNNQKQSWESPDRRWLLTGTNTFPRPTAISWSPCKSAADRFGRAEFSHAVLGRRPSSPQLLMLISGISPAVLREVQGGKYSGHSALLLLGTMVETWQFRSRVRLKAIGRALRTYRLSVPFQSV